MRKIKVLFFVVIFITPHLVISQITVKPQTSKNVNLIGKISHTGAMQTSGLSRKLPTTDALTLVGDEEINLYKQLREEANNTYKSVGVRKMALIDEEFAASILYFNDRDKFLLTFKNISYIKFQYLILFLIIFTLLNTFIFSFLILGSIVFYEFFLKKNKIPFIVTREPTAKLQSACPRAAACARAR